MGGAVTLLMIMYHSRSTFRIARIHTVSFHENACRAGM